MIGAAGRATAVVGDERGSVTMFVAVAAVGLLVLAGLVVDGSAKVRAVQRADRVAAEAARAAGQAIDLTAALQGSAIRADRRPALAAANAHLEAAGLVGSVELASDGSAITVVTRATEPTVFLSLIGVPRFTVAGHAEVRLVHSVRGEP
jgi:Flp pilus assembly protein TadG